jgi:trehalose-phosphatase
MEILQPGVDYEEFLRGLAQAHSRLLILDYDGTLAPFRIERDQAVPYPGVREALTELQAAGHTRLALVTGRPVGEALELLRMDPAPEVWGCHGWERRRADGTYRLTDPGPVAREGLRRALEATAGSRPGSWEQKPVSVAAHWRGQAPAEAEALRGRIEPRWRELAHAFGLELHAFDGGLELRVAGVHKGSAVTTLLDEAGPGTVAAYLGDDLTDEDAFTAIAGRGLGVLVREERRPSAASLWIRPPEELLAFFSRWMVTCPRGDKNGFPKSGW